MIRGLDGDRIRILRNGVGALDASSLSYDHAVPLDPVNVERIEIVRGPAALLYGGNAIGGVVNTFDNRIPDSPIEGSTAPASCATAAPTPPAAAPASWRPAMGLSPCTDANSRQFNDLRIPGYARSSKVRDSDEPGSRHRLENSDGRQDGGAIGGAYHWDRGYTGLSYSRYDSNYGSVAEPGVRLDMQQDHYGFASELRDLEGPFSSIKVDAGYTDYQHREIESGEVHTTFKNKGYGRGSKHATSPSAPSRASWARKSAATNSPPWARKRSSPHRHRQPGAVHARTMADQRALEPEPRRASGTHPHRSGCQGNATFASADNSESFTSASLSSGAVYQLDPVWSLAANLAYTERAPTFYELYANGAHVATGAFEVGDPNLNKEKAVSTDLALRFDNGTHKGSVGVFYSHFRNYIGLIGTGNLREGHHHDHDDHDHDHDHGELPEYRTKACAPGSMASKPKTAGSWPKTATAASHWSSQAITPAPRTLTAVSLCRVSRRYA